jgi:hypothetical protein
MAEAEYCVTTVRNGEKYYLLDAKDFSAGPVSVIPEHGYAERYATARATNDPTVMFDSPEEYSSFSPGELGAYAAYLLHTSGVLAALCDREIIVAYEAPDNRTYAPEPVERLAVV